MNKEAKARERARRIRSMIRRGMTQEQIDNYFKDETIRLVLCILYGTFTIEDGTKKKTVKKRDERHKVISTEVVEVPNILHGVEAAKKFAANEKIEVIGNGVTSIWVKTDMDNVDAVVEKLSALGRTSITKPEYKAEKKVKEKKPTNNTPEAKANAKDARKKERLEKTMRPYYAALRKGGVSKRIKKYNKTLADKIEKWIEERTSHKDSKEYRAQHRQLTSLEMKKNKKARKVAKRQATLEHIRARQSKATGSGKAAPIKGQQKASKPAQTELKMAA